MFENIVRIFKFARKSRNMTQAELADKLHISDKAWSKIETGTNQLEFRYIKPACDALDLPYLEVLQEICPVLPDTERILREHREGRVAYIRYSPEEDNPSGAGEQDADSAFGSYVGRWPWLRSLEDEIVRLRGGLWYDLVVTDSERALMQVLADYAGVAVDDIEFGRWFQTLIQWSRMKGRVV